MAETQQNTLFSQFVGMSQLPMLRQAGLLVGLAASVALALLIVQWAREPNFVPLYDALDPSEAAAIVTTLEQEGIPYQLRGDRLAVAGADAPRVRLLLAKQGLPKGRAKGFELLEGEQKFGTSSFIERARYNVALEGELALSIATMDSLKGARVHLAIPKSSAFVRQRSGPSASVVVSLYPGRELSKSQVAGIVHLIASSVPEMDSKRVAVVDQRGNLLTTEGGSSLNLSSEQFEYVRGIEQDYSRRIVDLLAPLLGPDKIRAQVAADLDFTLVERTSEVYGPDEPLLRSEQSSEERSSDNSREQGGAPGALAVQPPPAGVVNNQNPNADGEGEGAKSSSTASRTSKRATRNFEVDRTISHIKEVPGTITKLSVAVLVDYRTQRNEAGEIERVPLPDEELERITGLVKEAVGFDEERGDTVNLMNASFMEPEVLEPPPPLPVWQEPWVMDIAKQALGGIGVLVLVFAVLRPVMKNLVSSPRPGGDRVLSGELQLGADQVSLSGANGGVAQLPPGVSSYDQQVALAQSIADHSPKRAAQVMTSWVQDE